MSSSKPKSKSPTRARRALRITRVYTKIGDRGTTRLVGGQEIAKDHPRIHAYGTVDELSVCLGEARERIERTVAGFDAKNKASPLGLLARHLQYIQNLLFTLGGDLATCLPDRWPGMPLISADHVTYLEKLIDAHNDSLPPLTDFILPGGGPESLGLHACRVVARRAERHMRSLAAIEPVGDQVIPFINRLSDLFFVLARWMVAELNALGQVMPETLWNRALEQPPIPAAKPLKRKV